MVRKQSHVALKIGQPLKLLSSPRLTFTRSKAINYGLREASPGYCVILQDDVVLQEPNLEQMVHTLCETHQRRIGFISFRMAADVRCTTLIARLKIAAFTRRVQQTLPMIEDYNLVGWPGEHLPVKKVDFGAFCPKMIGIKSPVCITPELRELEPFLDEAFAPYCYDDFPTSRFVHCDTI